MTNVVIGYGHHFVKVVGVDSAGNVYVKDSDANRNGRPQITTLPANSSYTLYPYTVRR